MTEQGNTYRRRKGVDGMHGQNYEWGLTVLTYLRCQRLHEEFKKNGGKSGIKSFIVANNVDGAGNFDDVVVRVEYVVDNKIKNKIIFVQCKHITKPTKKLFPTTLGKENSLKIFYDSFIEIQTLKKEYNSDRNDRELQNSQENLLKMFLTCHDFELEVLLYSNIGFKEDKLVVYHLNKSKKDSDITTDIFNTANTESFEIRLNQDEEAFSGFEGNDNMKQLFWEELRFFLIQADNLDKHIDKEIKLLSNTTVDVDSLREQIFKEVQLHFTISNPCHSLTEKDDMLRNIANFIELRNKSKTLIENFCRNTCIKNIFSEQTINNIHNLCNSKNEHVIEIKSNFQKFEKLKFMQLLAISNFEFTSLFIDDTHDFEKLKLARKSKTYQELENVYVFSFNVISMIDGKRRNETLIQIVENGKRQTLSDYSKEFSIETENYIQNTKVCFQGEITDIKSLCGDKWKMVFDEKSVCDILENKLSNISTPLPTLDFYVERTFTKEILDEECYKERTKTWNINSNCIILFTEINECIPNHDANYKVFLNRKDMTTFVHKLLAEDNDRRSYHLCSHSNSQFQWMYSFGTKSNLTKENIIREDILTNETKEKISILSDVAGMGKTTTLLSLARKYKEKNPSHWVSFIELNKYIDFFKEVNEFPSTEFAVEFIATTLLNLKETELILFTTASKSGNFALFFDAFDEISPDAEKSFLSLLLALENTNIQNIFVSSRPNFSSSLEEKLLRKSIKFQGLTTEEKELALEGHWRQMLKNDKKEIEDGSLKEIAKKTIKLLQLKEKFLSEILAIPLQIRIVAIAYYKLLFNNSSEESDPINLAVLYEHFINSYAQRFYTEKYQMEWNLTVDKEKRIIQDKLKGAEEIACQLIIPEVLKNDIIDRRHEISALCDDVGIITHKSPVVFLHRTVAEYLSAKYLFCKILCNRNSVDIDIVKHILVDGKFNIVRKFINSLLMGTTAYTFSHYHEINYSINILKRSFITPLHVSASEGNLEIIKTLLSSNNAFLNTRNMFGETAIFCACKYVQTETVKLLLSYKDCSVNIRDNEHYNVLHYAVRIGDIEVMQLILQRDSSLLNMQNKSGFTPLHEAFRFGNTDAVKFFLSHKDYSVNISDYEGDTVLHYASRIGDIEIMKLILQRDSSLLNMQNKSGSTPLHGACKYLANSEAAIFLLSRSDCSVNIRDRDCNTVLHYASRRGDIEIMQLILQRDSSLLNMQNFWGFTPLHEACYIGKTESVKFFLARRDCMVKKQDFSYPRRLSALDVARKYGHSEIIELLLQHGAKSIESKCTCV